MSRPEGEPKPETGRGAGSGAGRGPGTGAVPGKRAGQAGNGQVGNGQVGNGQAGDAERTDRTGSGIVSHGPENKPNVNQDAGQDGDRRTSPDATPEAGHGTDGVPETAEGAAAESGEPADATVELGGLSALLGAVRAAGSDGGEQSDAAAGSGDGGGRETGGDVLDELALRRMLHGAVGDIAPREGTLDHLYRAVPARRARRRHTVVGLAAAALLLGTAVPAFVHVANSGGSATASPAIAGHGEQAQGGNGSGKGAENGGESGGDNGESENGGAGHGTPDASASPSDSTTTGADGNMVGGVADPQHTLITALPACDPSQLGVASTETGTANADGTVYGSFRIANVSATDCSVSSSGTVGFQTMGAADPAKIVVVQHTAGDAASGLPDPASEQSAVMLKPSMTYEVKFAWVPKDTCPTSGGGTPSPSPSDGPGTAVAGTGSSGDGTTTQLNGEDGGPEDGSVSVLHTPEPGAPVAAATIDNACAGTIYRTGVLEPTQ